MIMTAVDSPLRRMVRRPRPTTGTTRAPSPSSSTPSSAAATGATSNPVIVGEVMKKEKDHWVPRVRELAAANPRWSEVGAHVGPHRGDGRARRRRSCGPCSSAEDGRKGRLSLQTNPANYRDARADGRAGGPLQHPRPEHPGQVPVHRGGPRGGGGGDRPRRRRQRHGRVHGRPGLAVGEAVERGLRRYEAAGGDTSRFSPVCSLMVGRLDDWMKVLVERDDIALDPDAANWAGIAVFKRAYGIYRERGYRTRLLAAAYRHRLHWTELVGGDVVHDDAPRVAGAVQRGGHRARGRGSTSPWTRTSSTTCCAGSRTSGAPTSRTASRPRSSPGIGATGAHAARLRRRRTTISRAPCATSCCPTLTSSQPDRRHPATRPAREHTEDQHMAIETRERRRSLPILSHWIDGTARRGPARATGPVYNPATGQVIARVPRGGQAEVDAAVEAAARRRSRPGATCRSSPAARSSSPSASSCTSTARSWPRLITRDHGKTFPDALAEVHARPRDRRVRVRPAGPPRRA